MDSEDFRGIAKRGDDMSAISGYISELMNRRKECYEKAADMTVSTDGREKEEVAAEIAKKLIHSKEE